jgi:Family of unknown function (DUF6193)
MRARPVDLSNDVEMSAYPEPATLYPEVTATGSLAAALSEAAPDLQLSIPVEADGTEPLFRAVVPARMAHREALIISASHVERRWFIVRREPHQGLELIEGSTTDLSQVARVARAWRDGETLKRIAELGSFVELTGRIEVMGRDPAQMVESEWQHLRTEAAGMDWAEYQALINAAYDHPQLRRLYPFTSHGTLRFSTTTRPRLSREVTVCIHPGNRTEYVVTMSYGGDELGKTATAEDAVSLVVEHLPTSLAAVSYGAY